MKADWCIRLIVVILLTAASAGCTRRLPSKDPRSTALLISEFESVKPGSPFTVGVLITLEDGWHTYWKDPGDSGMAPVFEWQLPDGFTAGPVLWPEPQRLESPPLFNYIYENQVLLMVEIATPEDLPVDPTVTIECDFSWLICKDVCVVREAKLRLVALVNAETPRPSTKWHTLFEETRKQL